jgi:hypothetical protein
MMSYIREINGSYIALSEDQNPALHDHNTLNQALA